jgi:alpha-beta hydrolase superfamily lysophospholipase
MGKTTLQTSDGFELFVRRWPAAERRGAVLLLHGLGEHGGRYAHVAAALNGLGLEVWCHDQRGSGRAKGKRGDIPRHDALLDDAKLAFDRLAAETGEKPFLLGHSMGGAIAARAVTGGWINPRGLVLSSPSLRANMTAFQRFQVALGRRLTPGLALPHGLPVKYISRDPQTVAKYLKDPLVHGKISPRLAHFIVEAGECSRRDAAKLNTPTLLLVAGADRVVNPDGAREFAAAAPPELVTLHWYGDFYHEVFNEPATERARVLSDLRAWFVAQLGG